MKAYRDLPKDQRDEWLMSPTTEAFLGEIARELQAIDAGIVAAAREGVHGPLTRGGMSAALAWALRVARGEVSRDVA